MSGLIKKPNLRSRNGPSLVRKNRADYSSKKISGQLLDEVKTALKNIRGFGSIEIYVQNFRVTQITERNIKKTNHLLRD